MLFVFLFFWFIFKKSSSNERLFYLLVFYQKKPLCLYMELMDSKIQTKKRCYQKENESFRVYHIDETH